MFSCHVFVTTIGTGVTEYYHTRDSVTLPCPFESSRTLAITWFLCLGQLQHFPDMGVTVVPDNTSHVILCNSSLVISHFSHEAVRDGVDEASSCRTMVHNTCTTVKIHTSTKYLFDRSLGPSPHCHPTLRHISLMELNPSEHNV